MILRESIGIEVVGGDNLEAVRVLEVFCADGGACLRSEGRGVE